MRLGRILLFHFILITQVSFGQSIIDSCFTSLAPAKSFMSGADLANMGPSQADLLEWNGTSWIGDWPGANLTIPPPANLIGCRAIFIGATIWTPLGEGFGLRLSAPLIAGHTYSFTFNYVSHGFGSDGAFSPRIYTDSIPHLGFFVGNLPAVGHTWTTNTFSFTATSEQAGHTWIMVTTTPTESSGMINSFCHDCNDTTIVNCNVDLGPDRTLCEGDPLVLNATMPDAGYLWQDNSTDPTFNVTEEGTYWVTVTVASCSKTDSVHVAFEDCGILLDMPTVFTPNDDMVNDHFKPIRSKGITQADLSIYSRWGQRLFWAPTIRTGWDGRSEGILCPAGTYFWSITYTTIAHEDKIATGSLTLLR